VKNPNPSSERNVTTPVEALYAEPVLKPKPVAPLKSPVVKAYPASLEVNETIPVPAAYVPPVQPLPFVPLSPFPR
jgi:hypothetical protein